MKRSPITRRTPMPRGSALRRLSVIRRRRLHADPVWAAVRKAVWERCGGLCERCGRALNLGVWECHHRKFRSRGGRHSVVNAVALDDFCHRWVHYGGGRLPAAHGFAVRSTADPARVPVLRYDGRWVLLTTDGGYALTTEEAR